MTFVVLQLVQRMWTTNPKDHQLQHLSWHQELSLQQCRRLSAFKIYCSQKKKAQTASSDLRRVDVCLVSPPQRWACGGKRVTGVFTSGSGSRHLPNWNQVAAIKQRRKHTTLGLCNTFRFIPSLVCPLEPTARVLSLTLSFSPRSLINKIKPGIVKRVNRLPTPIAGLVSLFSFCSAVNSCVEH